MRTAINNGDTGLLVRTALNTMTSDLYYGLTFVDAQISGAVADGVTDDFAALQSLIDNYGQVRIGQTRADIFLISQPLIIPSNKNIRIDGTILIMAGLVANLAVDVAIGDTTFTVDDASNFVVGQWVGVTDDNTLQVYATSRAWTGEILDITGNVITLDNASFSVLEVSANGYAAHCQNNILISEVSNVTITGSGLIDGNKANQYQLHPVREQVVTEQQRAGCGITVYISEDISINGIDIQDSLLHNLAITAFETGSESKRIFINNIKCLRGHDKNINVKWGHYIYFDNIYCDGAVWEDGLRFYSSNKYCFVFNATLINNARAGIGFTSVSNEYGAFTNIYTSGNGDYGMDIGSPYINASNINSQDRLRISDVQADAHDINLSNVNLVGVTAAQSLWIQGGVRRTRITGLSIVDGTGIGLQTTSSGGEEPTGIKIVGGEIFNNTGASTDIVAGTDIAYVEFDI